MEFDLIANKRFRTGRNRLLNQGDREIGDTNVPRQAELFDMGECAERLLEWYPRIGPVQQQQINGSQMPLVQALLGRALKIVRGEMGGPDLGGHEDIVALDPRGAQCIADLAFVLVNLRVVNVTIAEPDGLLDHARAGTPAQFPSAQSGRGNGCAVGFDKQHRRIPDRPLCPAATPMPTQRAAGSVANAANTVSGACAITASSARAGPRGIRLPCSQLRMVSTGTPNRAANSSWVSRARRRSSRTADDDLASSEAGDAVVAGARGIVAGASGNSRPSRNSTIRPSAFSRKRCMVCPQALRECRRCPLRLD